MKPNIYTLAGEWWDSLHPTMKQIYTWLHNIPGRSYKNLSRIEILDLYRDHTQAF